MNTLKSLSAALISVSFLSACSGADDRTTSVEMQGMQNGRLVNITREIPCSRLAGADPERVETYTGLASAIDGMERDFFQASNERKEFLDGVEESAGRFVERYGQMARAQFEDKFEIYDSDPTVATMQEMLVRNHGVQNFGQLIRDCN